MSNSIDTIVNIIAELKPGEDFAGSADFIVDGLLDSFDILALVEEIEETLGVDIDGEAIVPENFGSFAAIAALAERSERA